jgi:hypothetical protein
LIHRLLGLLLSATMSSVSERDVPVAQDVNAGSADNGPTEADADAAPGPQLNPSGTLAVAVLDAALLATTARIGAAALLVGIALTQAVFALSWVFGTALPGRRGALVLAALAAVGADVAVSVRPHAGLGALLPVVGLAVPAMFVHQLVRGAARVRLLESVGLIGVLIVAIVAVPALPQLWHEFGDPATSGRVVSAAVLAVGAALIAGLFIDLVAPVPHFDAAVDRGLLAVLGAAVVGGAVGYLALRSVSAFAGGRSLFVGAALGALAALLAVATSFVEHSTPYPSPGFARRVRPALGALVPMAFASPVALVICLAIRA